MGRTFAGNDEERAKAILRNASATVRSYTRKDFTVVADTVRVRPIGGKARLAKTPVVSIESVKLVSNVDGTDTLIPTTWSYGGGDTVHLVDSNVVVNYPELVYGDEDCQWVEIAYHHGYEEVPDDIIAVVENMVIRQLSLPGGGIIESETIGPYTTRYASNSTAGPLSITEPERRILNKYRRTARTVELR